MHYFQQRYLRENRQFPNLAGMETIDLPNKGLLSGIEIRVEGTMPQFTDTPDVWLHDRIKKIEVIVNGSQVVKSLTGEQLQALMFYQRTPLYNHDQKNLSAGLCEEQWYINLGRDYHDLEYMLDLGQVNDPELRIEYDFEMTSHHGWTNGVAMSEKPYYNIICHLLRDTALVPKGYIKTSEIYRFQMARNKQENMTIARGPVYSNLYLQSWYKDEGHGLNIDHIELNINSDDIIPIRVHLDEWMAEVTRMYGVMEYQLWTLFTGGQAYPFPLETGHADGETEVTQDIMWAFSNLWANLSASQLKVVSTGAISAGSFGAHVKLQGGFPFSLGAIPLFDPWDKDTWIDSSKLGDLWLRVEIRDVAPAGTHVFLKLLADEVVTSYVTPSWP